MALAAGRGSKRGLHWAIRNKQREEFNPKNSYYAFSRSLETEKFFLEHLDKRMVIGDWQYTCPCYPVETSKIFVDAGFDVLICPWDRGWKQIKACVDTAMDGLYGIMHTTWNTINNGLLFFYKKNESILFFNTKNQAKCQYPSFSVILGVYDNYI